MQKVKKTVLLILGMMLSLSLFVGCIIDDVSQNNNTNQSDGANQSETSQESAVASVFDGDCGISASAEIGNNLIGYPELKITIANTTEKEITAVKFYAVPMDVYGEEIKGWTIQNDLYTDTSIPAGKTNTISYQFIEDSVKTVNLYVYSVYFADGSEWGDKDAPSSKIIKNAPKIEVTVLS